MNTEPQPKARTNDVEINSELSDGINRVEKNSVRESLENAVAEHKDDSPENSRLASILENKRANIKAQRNDSDVVASSDETEPDVVTTSGAETPDVEATIPAELQADFSKLDPPLQRSFQSCLTKINEEITTTKQEIARLNQINAIEEIVDDHLPEYKDYGIKFKADFVGKLLNLQRRLSDPNYGRRVAAFEELAYKLRINLAEAARYQPDPNFHARFQQEASQFAQQTFVRKHDAAYQKHTSMLEKWSKNKPQFNDQVRAKMLDKFIELYNKDEIPLNANFADQKWLDKVYKLVTGADVATTKKQPTKKPTKINIQPGSVRDSILKSIRENSQNV